MILFDWKDLIDQTVIDGEGETAAQFQERCAQTAIKQFWAQGVKQRGERPDHPSNPPPPKQMNGSEMIAWLKKGQN